MTTFANINNDQRNHNMNHNMNQTSITTQFRIFNAMLSNNNYHFLNEACMLLARTQTIQNTNDLTIIHAHNKLLQKIVRASETQSVATTYINQYNLKYI